MWPKGKTIDDAVVIGEQEGGLYKLKGQPEQTLVHDLVEPNELWYRRLLKVSHNCRQNMKVYAKDVRKGITQRKHFQVARARKKESWKSSTPMYAVQCHPIH